MYKGKNLVGWVVPLVGGLCLSVYSAAPAAVGAVGESGNVTKREFGKTPDGKPVELYALNNGRLTVKVMTYGAIITEIDAPDRTGKEGDIVLGFDTLEGYLGTHPYFGATVGRVANRIAGARFTLGGVDYQVAANDGPHSLHGGKRGFDKVVWKAEPTSQEGGASIKLTYRSRDGEEGYPGNLSVSVTFTVTDQDELRIEYAATTDKATPINLSNHSYFNLAGRTTEPILGHQVMLAANRYTPVDDKLIPTGETAPVAGTPLDFTKPTEIGARSTNSRASLGDTTTTSCSTAAADRWRWRRGSTSPRAGVCWKCSPPSPASSSTPATSWTARSGAKTASPTASTTGSAWKPSTIPTRSTTPVSHRRS